MSMYVPTSLFLGLCIVLLFLLFFSFKPINIKSNDFLIDNKLPNIISSLLAMFLSLYLAQVVINHQLIENIGGIASDGTVIQGITIIYIPALSYVFTFIGLSMLAMTIYHSWAAVQSKNNKLIEIDF